MIVHCPPKKRYNEKIPGGGASLSETVGAQAAKFSEEQKEPSSETPARFHILDKPSDLLGIVGFGLYLAWFFLTLSCTTVSEAEGDVVKVSLVLSFLLGEALVSLLIFASTSQIAKSKTDEALFALSAICLILPGIAEIAQFGEMLLLGSWLLSGVGAVILLSFWGFFLSQLPHKQACMYPALSALIAVLILATLVLGLKEIMAPFASMFVALCSIGLFIMWRTSANRHGELVTPENTRPPDPKALLRSEFAMIANNFLIGFSFFVLASVANIGIKAVLLLAMLAAGVFKVIDSYYGPIYQVNTIVRIIAPVATTCLLLLPFASEPYQYVLIFVMMFVSITDEIICWTAVAEYMHVYQVNPFANMAFGRIGEILGLMSGFFAASAVFAPALGAVVEPNIVLSLIVIAFVFFQAFVFKDNYTPYMEHYAMEKELESDEEADENPAQGEWHQKIVRFADANKLTPRQTEVLFLLSKRYSMNMIERELVVSIHTVKAHIYTIYQKTGVHSREELIDKIEAFE